MSSVGGNQFKMEVYQTQRECVTLRDGNHAMKMVSFMNIPYIPPCMQVPMPLWWVTSHKPIVTQKYQTYKMYWTHWPPEHSSLATRHAVECHSLPLFITWLTGCCSSVSLSGLGKKTLLHIASMGKDSNSKSKIQSMVSPECRSLLPSWSQKILSQAIVNWGSVYMYRNPYIHIPNVNISPLR
jgi:hypothetical protein